VWQDLLSSGTAQTASQGAHRQETNKHKISKSSKSVGPNITPYQDSMKNTAFFQQNLIIKAV
jgi:hypothetical protein